MLPLHRVGEPVKGAGGVQACEGIRDREHAAGGLAEGAGRCPCARKGILSAGGLAPTAIRAGPPSPSRPDRPAPPPFGCMPAPLQADGPLREPHHAGVRAADAPPGGPSAWLRVELCCARFRGVLDSCQPGTPAAAAAGDGSKRALPSRPPAQSQPLLKGRVWSTAENRDSSCLREQTGAEGKGPAPAWHLQSSSAAQPESPAATAVEPCPPPADGAGVGGGGRQPAVAAGHCGAGAFASWHAGRAWGMGVAGARAGRV